MREYIIGVPGDEPLSSLRRSGKTITAIAKIVGNCDEVIRCKDCKYYKVYELLGGTLPLCNRIRTSMTDTVEPDDFCSRAERKEE